MTEELEESRGPAGLFSARSPSRFNGAEHGTGSRDGRRRRQGRGTSPAETTCVLEEDSITRKYNCDRSVRCRRQDRMASALLFCTVPHPASCRWNAANRQLRSLPLSSIAPHHLGNPVSGTVIDYGDAQ